MREPEARRSIAVVRELVELPRCSWAVREERFEITVRLMGASPLTNQCLSELATHGSGLAQTPIMFAFMPIIGVLARSFNLFRKNFSGWVDSIGSALPIPRISVLSAKSSGRFGMFG